ncbi:LuxR C-terminal-related transcriptional regulator [Burkholderia sp. L27(2015)]|jgi:DNA-binding CsgD family transcriptional regulator|uniref:LuxR C-terminal-related transcriptional regulator n=1 Tax=Burkholderia sp. L27(2015) TaxID=1641858 RepID=UPI00131E6A46|nr:LuxR C-terminal-related transcriptional regulator [Burkholderia sp. L27(2015)]
MTTESQLFDLIQKLPNPLNLKEPKSGKYVFANDPSAKQIGLESAEQMVGLTVRDLDFSQSESGNTLAEKIARMDSLVQQKKERVRDTATFFNRGVLVHETVIKFPARGSRGNVIGIYTFNQELTESLSHQTLYTQYKKICGKNVAIKKLLQHLEVEPFFFTPPSEMELMVLLERVAGRSDKEIARTFDVSFRTINTHIARLRTKLQGDVLSGVVARLRRRVHGMPMV